MKKRLQKALNKSIPLGILGLEKGQRITVKDFLGSLALFSVVYSFVVIMLSLQP